MIMYEYVFQVLFILSNLLYPNVSETPVDQCDGGVPKPSQVDIVGCNVQPCQFIRGQDIVMYMDFITSEDIDELKAELTAKTFGISVNYPLPKPDVCGELTNAKCPLKVNQKVQYKFTMPIAAAYPPVSVKLTFYLLANSEKKKPLVCFSINGKVV